MLPIATHSGRRIQPSTISKFLLHQPKNLISPWNTWNRTKPSHRDSGSSTANLYILLLQKAPLPFPHQFQRCCANKRIPCCSRIYDLFDFLGADRTGGGGGGEKCTFGTECYDDILYAFREKGASYEGPVEIWKWLGGS